MDLLAILMLLGILLAAYFIPTIVASAREHHNTTAIFWVNLLLGWSLAAWVVALVWAFSRPRSIDDSV